MNNTMFLGRCKEVEVVVPGRVEPETKIESVLSHSTRACSYTSYLLLDEAGRFMSHSFGTWQTFFGPEMHFEKFLGYMARELQCHPYAIIGPVAELTHACVAGQFVGDREREHARWKAAAARVVLQQQLQIRPGDTSLQLGQRAVEAFGMRYRPYTNWECDADGRLHYKPENADYYVEISHVNVQSVDLLDIIRVLHNCEISLDDKEPLAPVLTVDTPDPRLQEALAKIEAEREEMHKRRIVHARYEVDSGLDDERIAYPLDVILRTLMYHDLWGTFEWVELRGDEHGPRVMQFLWQKTEGIGQRPGHMVWEPIKQEIAHDLLAKPELSISERDNTVRFTLPYQI